MLDKLPAEVLSHIAYHLCIDTLSPPVALLQSCRAIHNAVSPQADQRLYARLFRSAFDTQAAERRLGKLASGRLAAELRRRVTALRRIARMIRASQVLSLDVQDLWLIYIMMIENDGKNIKHLFSGDVSVSVLIKLVHDQIMLPAALEPGLPAENEVRALVMWIGWLLAGYEYAHGIDAQGAVDQDERLFVLRPYVFAPQRYELFFAPWTVADLPLAQDPGSDFTGNPFWADLRPKARRSSIQHYGKQLLLSAPILSHAAMLSFFTKRPSRPSPTSLVDPFEALGLSRPPRPLEDDDDDDDDDESFGMIRDLLSKSTLHDRDFDRLTKCYNPYTCPGVSRAAWRGAFDGCWEGTFSFFEFDAFRDMIAGHSRALYQGQFGEQAQVWRIKETWVWRTQYGRRVARQRAREQEERAARAKAERAARLAELGQDAEEPTCPSEKPRGLPLHGPATNAGFPTLPPRVVNLDTPAAEDETLRETMERQVESIEGYEVVPDTELDQLLASPGEHAPSGLEVILTGVGHSAWGRFILKGKVRAWDGMASLVKEYSPDSRGKWIYRGYILSGDSLVGRWRDTFTPEEYVGYEGTFILYRRR